MNVHDNGRGCFAVPNTHVRKRNVHAMLNRRPIKRVTFFKKLLNAFKFKKLHEQYKYRLQLQIDELDKKMNTYIIQEKAGTVRKELAGEGVKDDLQHLATPLNGNNSEQKTVNETLSDQNVKKCIQNKWDHNKEVTIMTNNVLMPPISIKINKEKDNSKDTNKMHCLYSKIAKVIVSRKPNINMNDVQDIANLLKTHIARTNKLTSRMFNVVTPEMPLWALKGFLENEYRNETKKLVGNLIDKMAYYIVLKKGQILPSDIEEFCAELIIQGKCKGSIKTSTPERSTPQTPTNTDTQLETTVLYSLHPNDCLKNRPETNQTKSDETSSDSEYVKDLDSVNSKISLKTSDQNRMCIDEAIEKSIKTLEYLKEISGQLFLPDKITNNILEISSACKNTSTHTLKLVKNYLDNNIPQKQIPITKRDIESQTCFSTIDIDKPLVEQNLVKDETKIKQNDTDNTVLIHNSNKRIDVRMPSLIVSSEAQIKKINSKQIPMCKAKDKEVVPVIQSEAKEKCNQSSEKNAKKILTVKKRRESATKCNILSPLPPASDDKTTTNASKKHTDSTENKTLGSISFVKSPTNKQNIQPLSLVNTQQPKSIIKESKYLASSPFKPVEKPTAISKSHSNRHPQSPESIKESSKVLLTKFKRLRAKSQSDNNVKDVNGSFNTSGIRNKLIENKICDEDFINKSKYLAQNKHNFNSKGYYNRNFYNYNVTIPSYTAGDTTISNELSNQKNVKAQTMIKRINETHLQETSRNSETDKNTETSNAKDQPDKDRPYLKSSKTYAVFKPFHRINPVSREGPVQISNELNTENKLLPNSIDTKRYSNIYGSLPPTPCHNCTSATKCKTRISKIPITQQMLSNRQRNNLSHQFPKSS